MDMWNKTIKNTWIWAGSLATMVIGGLIVEYAKEYPIPGTIWNAMLYLWERFIALMTVDIKLWLIIIFIGAIFIIRYVFNNTKTTKTIEVCTAEKVNANNDVPQQPKILSYTKEYVDGIPWEWEWEKVNEIWHIQNLQPYCPKDGGRLIKYSNDCPICNANYFGVANGDKAAAIIELKIKKLLQNEQQHL